MYSYQNNRIGLGILICCVAILIAIVSPVQSADQSRVLTIGLFASGVALKFGSVFVANAAQDTYDQYLSTGIQSDLAKHRDDYESQRNLSIGMSRTGIGFVGLAVLISVLDQFEVISESSAVRSARLNIEPSYNPRTGDAALTFQRKF